MNRRIIIKAVIVLIIVCGSIYILPHFLFPHILVNLLPGNIIENVSAEQLLCMPSRLTGQVVTFTLRDGKSFVCNRMVAETDILGREKPFVVQLEDVDPAGLFNDFPDSTFSVVRISGIRKKHAVVIDSVHGEGVFGRVDGVGSFSGELLDFSFTIQLKTEFIKQLPFVSKNEINPDQSDYTVSVDIEGTVSQPQITVTSELFQFSLKKNV